MLIERDRLVGAARYAQGWLIGADEMPEFPTALERELGPALDALPAQWHSVGNVERTGRWIEFAALVEANGHWDAAWDVLAAISTVLAVGKSAAGLNVLAFLSARRGRVARMAGRLDDAEECYAVALQSADRSDPAFAADVYPMVWLGRSVLSVERGNYPRARRCASRALRDVVPSGHRAQAHQILGLIERKVGRLDVSLRHLWNAHDLSDGHPTHQAAIKTALAETVAAQGETCAAMRAWLSVLGEAQPPRLAVPSLVGVMRALYGITEQGDPCGRCLRLIREQPWATALRTTRTLDELIRGIVTLAADIVVGSAEASLRLSQLTPHEIVEMQLARSELLAALGEHDDSRAVAQSAQQTSEQLGLHERTFQSEALVQLLAASARRAERSRNPSPQVARFFALPTEESSVAVGST
jgi:tetratricopeptide (TPR) repeat protein